jgi:D-xylose transport system ATP-binding protein
MTEFTPVLELRGISKRFGAVQALSGVDFSVGAGEVVALVGDNGAGKSTLVKVMSGIYDPDEGEYRFDGQAVNVRGPQAAADLGVATVYQDLALADNLDVVGNLFLGHELTGPGPQLNETNMEHRAHELLSTLSTTIPSVRTEVASLSGGQRQQVAIARSLLGEPKVVLLDEPTAALGVPQTRQVLDLIKRLKDRGLGVVVISHNMADVFEVADRIIVLYLGRTNGDFRVADVTREDVVAAITGLRTNGKAAGTTPSEDPALSNGIEGGR